MMANWHEASCKRPDVLVDASGSMSSCLNCGAYLLFAQPKSGKLTDTDRYPPVPIKPLWWPPSVRYLSPGFTKKFLADPSECLCNSTAIEFNFSWESTLTHKERFESKPFVYSNLTESTHFRLLRLSAGNFVDALHGWVEVVDSRDQIEYQAVSYPWADGTGDKSLCRRIFLGNDHRPLPITLNCFRALRHLRKPGVETCLWIDAVCINQQSLTERSHQVGLMFKIFSSATNVCVYCGGEDDIPETTSVEAIKLLNTALRDGNDAVPRAKALQTFFNRPYFSRLWVVQEVLLAQSLSFHCGMVSTKPMKRADLGPALAANSSPRWMSLMTDTPDIQRTTRGLLSILATTHACKASDMRDKIFGLLGLIEETVKKQLAPDYTLTIREVYIGTAAFLIQNHHSLDILNFAGLEDNGCSLWTCSHNIPGTCSDIRGAYGIPSWVPLWTRAPYDNASSLEEMASRRNQFESETESYASTRSPRPMENTRVVPLSPSIFIKKQRNNIVDQTNPLCNAEVCGDTGELVVGGRMIYGILPKLVRQESITAMPENEICEVIDEDDQMMKKVFYRFPGGAVIGLGLPKQCQCARDRSKYQVLAVYGYDYFLVAVPHDSLTHPSAFYKVVGPCQIVIICSLSSKSPAYQSVAECILAIEEFFPMTLEKIRFLLEWRRIIQLQGTNETGPGHELHSPGWTTDFRQAEVVWQQYCNYTEAKTCESDQSCNEILDFLEFWQPTEFKRVGAQLNRLKYLSQFHNFLEANESLYASCPNWGSVNVNVKQDSMPRSPWDTRLACDTRLVWGTRFSEAVNEWLRERTSLMRLLHDLLGVDIIVKIHNDEEMAINENFIKVIYDELRSLPSRIRDRDEVDKKTRQLLMDRDFCWKSLDACLDLLKSTPSYFRDLESALALARCFQDKEECHDIVLC